MPDNGIPDNSEREQECEQIRRVFSEHGLAIDEIVWNNNLDRWRVTVTADGTDERFLEEVGEIGSSKPVDHTLNFTAVREFAIRRIDGTDIEAGTINVPGTEGGAILIRI